MVHMTWSHKRTEDGKQQQIDYMKSIVIIRNVKFVFVMRFASQSFLTWIIRIQVTFF